MLNKRYSNFGNQRNTNFGKVNSTFDMKMKNIGNSYSLAAADRMSYDLNISKTSNKSPDYAQRNISIENHRTYDERNPSNLDFINPLEFKTKIDFSNNSNANKYERLMNHRYKLQALMDQKRKSLPDRKKSSNNKRQSQKKIEAYYRNKYVIDKNFKNKFREKKKQISNIKSTQNRKLLEVNSAQDYSFRPTQFMIQNNSSTNNTTNLLTNDETIQDKVLKEDEILLTNPEDCKDTIFSGEGEIPCSAGETKFRESSKQSNDALVLNLQNENKFLREKLAAMTRLFTEFKSKVNIPLEPENIKLISDDDNLKQKE